MDKETAIKELRRLFRAGSTAYTNVTHVSRSGMTRYIEVYRVRGNEIINVTALVATALDMPIDYQRGGVKVQGVGMDMGFALVYEMSRTVHAKSRSKRLKDRADTGYLISQRWL